MTRSRNRRNRYVGKWAETPSRQIDLPFSEDSLEALLTEAAEDRSSWTHQEIAGWCDSFFFHFLDREPPELSKALEVAEDVDAQWELFLANTYSLEELQNLDFSTVRLPIEWFQNWLIKLRAV